MLPRRATLQSSFLMLAVLAGASSFVAAQTVSRPAKQAQGARKVSQAEVALAIALRSNPLTAPYPISTTWRDGAVDLSGRVGTKQIHDAAVLLAIDSGLRFRDNLVIDTAAAHEAALNAPSTSGTPQGLAGASSSSPYVYPPPLLGWLDDPFFGMVPPIVSFPPWWTRSEETSSLPPPRKVQDVRAAGPPGATRGISGTRGESAAAQDAVSVPPVQGQIEISVDEFGQVVLRGVVASEEAGREIEQAARSVPGVTRVETQFQIQPRRAGSEAPPPPPQPMLGPQAPASAPNLRAPGADQVRPRRAPAAPAALDPKDLSRRVVDALKRRPVTAELPIKVRSGDGIVTLTGQVPSAYEAMIVYRTAQQTPGVREIVDHLDFAVPDEDHPNPLVQRGRPEDLEPYLASQIRRHLGDLAQLDRIQARGDILELRGTLLHAEDQDRLMAILRSIPLLKGFQLDSKFNAD